VVSVTNPYGRILGFLESLKILNVIPSDTPRESRDGMFSEVNSKP
jgi:hypothetical protein